MPGVDRASLGAALANGVTPAEAREIVYQAVPYAGMGKVFDFIHATNEVLTERGVQLPLEGQATTSPVTRAEKGRAVQEQIVGTDRVQRMYASAAGDELHSTRWPPSTKSHPHLRKDSAGRPSRLDRLLARPVTRTQPEEHVKEYAR